MEISEKPLVVKINYIEHCHGHDADDDRPFYDLYECPICGVVEIYFYHNFCPWCGAELDWSRE